MIIHDPSGWRGVREGVWRDAIQTDSGIIIKHFEPQINGS